MAAWLLVGLASAITFWAIVWPLVFVYASAVGLVLLALAALWSAYVRGVGYPRARALDPAERTWERYR